MATIDRIVALSRGDRPKDYFSGSGEGNAEADGATPSQEQVFIDPAPPWPVMADDAYYGITGGREDNRAAQRG